MVDIIILVDNGSKNGSRWFHNLVDNNHTYNGSHIPAMLIISVDKTSQWFKMVILADKATIMTTILDLQWFMS